MSDAISKGVADEALGPLIDELIRKTADRSPDLAQAILCCSVPRWFDEQVLTGVRSREAALAISDDELLQQLQALPFCEPHPTRESAWAFRQSFREHLLARQEVQEHWQELHLQAAETFQMMLEIKDLQGEVRFEDPEWRALAAEWLYHLFHVDALSGLSMVRQLCAEALAAWQVGFCSEFLAGIGWPDQVQFLQAGVDALVLERDAEALPMLKSLAETEALSPDQASALHYWIGYIHHRSEGRLAPALERLTRALDLAPDNAYILAEMAAVHASPGPTWGRFDLALEHARAAKELNPEAAIGYTALGEIRVQLEDWEDAISWYQEALEKEPEDVDALLALSRVYAQQGQATRALEMIDAVAQATPGVEYYISLLRGTVYRQAQQYERALETLETAREEAPHHIEAHLALGELHAARYQSVRAEHAYRRAIELKPREPDGYLALAELFNELGRREEAVAVCRQALDEVTDARTIYIALSKLHSEQGEVDRVVWAQEQLVARDPAQAYAYHCAVGDAMLSLVWQDRHAPEQEQWLARAQAEFEKALGIDTKRAWAYMSLAEVSVLRKADAAAQSNLEKLRNQAPWGVYDALTNLGTSYQASYQYTAAEQALEGAVNREAHRAAAWRALIDLYRWLGNLDGVESARACLLRANPMQAYDGHIAVGDAYKRIEHNRRARREYNQAVELDPEGADGYLQLAEVDEADSELESAIENYLLVADKGPDLAALAYARIAAIHRRLGDLEEAEEICRRAIRFDARQAHGYLELARLGVVARRPSLAEEARGRLEEVLPHQRYELELALGEIYGQIGSEVEAQQAYERCIELDPGRADAYAGLGRLLVSMDRYTEAEELLNKALEIESAHMEAYTGLIELCLRQGDLQGMIRLGQRIIELDPAAEPLILVETGAVYETLSELDAAEQKYLQAIELAPWRLDGHLALASVLRQQDRSDAAWDAYRRVAELAGVDYLALGSYYEQQGKLADASSVYRLAIEEDGKNEDAYWRLASLLAQEGKFDEAAELPQKMRRHRELAWTAENLNGQLEALQQKKEAEDTYRRAIALAPERPEAYWNLAQFLDDQGRKAEAIDVYEQAIEVDPEQVASYLGAARLCGEVGLVEAMEDRVLQAMAIAPDDPVACRLLASLRERQRQWDEAARFYDRTLRRDPRDVEAYFGLGRIYEQQNDLVGARAMYAQALDLAPRYGDIYLGLGRVYAKQGDVVNLDLLVGRLLTLEGLEAEEEYNARLLVAELYRLVGDDKKMETAYREAIGLAPHLPDAYQELAALYTELGALDSAIQVHRQVIGLQPDDAAFASEEYNRLGDLLIGAARYDEAEKALREALHNDPSNAGAYYSLGVTYEQQGALEQAASMYTKATEEAPKHGEAYIALARVYSRKGDTDGLERMVQRILEMELDPDETYYTRVLIAAAYRATGDTQRTEETFRQAIATYPKRPEAHEYLADLLVEQNRLDDAIEEYKITAELQPEAASDMYERIGDLLSQRGRYDEALDALLTAVKRDSTNHGAYYSLGWVHEQRGAVDRALTMYTHATDLFPKYGEAYVARARVYGALGDAERLDRMVQRMQDLVITEAERYEAYLIIAEVYRAAGEGRGEETAYRSAITLDPERAEAYEQLAQRLFDLERPGEAAQVLTQMADQPHLAYSAQVSLGNLLAAQERNEEADRAYRQAIHTDPNQTTAYLQLALLCLERGESGVTDELLQQALNIAPDDPHVHSVLAQFHEQQEDWDKAVDSYHRLAELDPDSASSAYERIGDLLIGLKRYEEAEQVLLEAVQSDPYNAGAHFSLGLLYEEQEDLVQSAAQYTKATEAVPKYADAYIALSRVYRKQNEVSRIAEMARRFLALDMEHAERYEAHIVLAAAYVEAELYDWAVDVLHKAVELDPERPEAYNGLGQVFEMQQRWAGARNAYAMVGQLRPEWQPDVYLRIGQILIEEGKQEKAEEAYLRAAELAPDRGDVRFALGRLYRDSERWVEAIQAFEKGTDHDFDLACSAHLYIGDIHRRLGNAQEMRDACTKVISLVDNLARPDHHGLRRKGLAHFMLGEHAEASQALHKALEANAADLQARFYLALNLLCQDELGRSQEELQRGIAVAQRRGDFLTAIEEAEVLAQREPEVPGARELLSALIEARDKIQQPTRTQP